MSCVTRVLVLLLAFAQPFCATLQAADILQVGPERALKTPSQAARVARHGDVIEIDAGRYVNDYTVWSQNDLTIRGVGGMAHLHSRGLIPNGKAIWIIDGHGTVIENVRFSGAKVRDTNGAGIRHQGGDLTLRNTFFHDNEFSVLSGHSPRATIRVSDSRFWFQKRSNRYSHGIYIGTAGRFILEGSHFKGTDQGHQIKSRALENRILYNRIEDIEGGNSSRLIDLSNCGLSFVIGNDMHKGAGSHNFNAIGFGPEGCEGRTERQQQLYVVHNTFINEAPSGIFVWNNGGGEALVANNLLLGRGVFLRGAGQDRHNVRATLSERQFDGWEPAAGSKAIDSAVMLPDMEMSLRPQLEFRLPAGTRPRPVAGAQDMGSRERAKGAQAAGH